MGRLKTRDLTSRDWTPRHHIARVDIARPDNSAIWCRVVRSRDVRSRDFSASAYISIIIMVLRNYVRFGPSRSWRLTVFATVYQHVVISTNFLNIALLCGFATTFFIECVVSLWNSLPNTVDSNSLAVLNVLLNAEAFPVTLGSVVTKMSVQIVGIC